MKRFFHLLCLGIVYAAVLIAYNTAHDGILKTAVKSDKNADDAQVISVGVPLPPPPVPEGPAL